ncbi:MAG: DUF2974 domain-containing protein [Ruminococcus sp.]|nr:DUF2974 domain-containing protein [Ruminococcus sp.]
MKNSKATMSEYVDWRGDLSFKVDKLNEVDCLIFATLAYIDYDLSEFSSTANLASAPTLAQVYCDVKNVKCFGSMFLPLLKKCALSQRFKDTKVMYHKSIIDLEEQTQFSATTFVLPSSEIVVAFRGTDDSLVGWQEDFNMAVGTIPAHKHARRYLCDIADSIADSPIYVVGHSKGGNLAVWASAHLYDIYSNRLKKVFDFDGPGFYGDFTESDEYRAIIDKTTKYVVDASIIGMLLSSSTQQIVVESIKHNSMLQHMTNTWNVLGTKLCRLKERSSRGLNSQAVIEELIESLSCEERKQFTLLLAEIVSSSNIQNFSELKSIDNIPQFFESIKNSASSEEDKKFAQSIIKRVLVIIKNQTLSLTGIEELKEKGIEKLSAGRSGLEELKEKGLNTLSKIQKKK